MRMKLQPILAASLFAVLGASCSTGDPNSGSAAVELRWKGPQRGNGLRGMLSGIVDTVKVSVSADGKALVQQSFLYEANQGTVTDIPAGVNRSFQVDAIGGSTVLYSGTADNVTIIADKTVDVPVDMHAVYSQDIYPPAAINDLTTTVTGSVVNLAWTATGDDAYFDQAASYDLRWSNSTIQASNFDSATKVNGLPAPAAAGTSEHFSINGLALGATYHFAIKSIDDAGNISAISNEALATLTADTTPPADVTNLTVNQVVNDSVTLTWTAPGDDGNTGTVAQYDVRYSTANITAANFSGASQAGGPANPVAAGQTQLFTVSGLSNGQKYYFALKAVDAAGNWSGMSNVVNATVADQVAPAQVTDLGANSASDTSVTLTWTAPGDDGNVGTAASYEIRYSTGVINAGNFTQATLWPTPPTPQVAGSQETVDITGLTKGTAYTFALIATDDAGNPSPLSNVATATPGQQDVTAPADVTNLSVGGITETGVTLSWLAPGDDGMVGTVASYNVRSSTSNITDDASFNAATQVPWTGTIVSGNSTQTLPVTGLTTNTKYYFALKATDDSNNPSGMSNVASGTPADIIAPSAVADLAVGGTTNTTVTLTWTAPHDDTPAEAVQDYEIRYSTSAIDTGNFSLATQWMGAPTPQAPGTGETTTVTPLTQGTTYWFALISHDEALNPSPLSNVRQATPGGPPDTTPPSDVSDLSVFAVTETGVTLHWTAPGDDGNVGTATSYEIRYSTSVINTGNFSQATLWPTTPTPQVAGSQETVNITGLTPDTLYYFALKTADEVPNWSGISNVPSGTPTDLVPPDDIITLAAPSVTKTSVHLTWTAPGDDGTVGGPVTAYDVRYSNAAINSGNFASATQATWSGAIVNPGVQQAFDVTGLTSDILYHFAVKAVDDKGNWSGVSNDVSNTPTDLIAPAAITDLAAPTVTQTSVHLTWTAPGDDGSGGGPVTTYDVRYSQSPITDNATFNGATQATWTGTIVLPGQVQVFDVTGLTTNVLYYFAVKSADAKPNWSNISNHPVSATPADIPPATVTDLAAAATATAGDIKLTWTAPGEDGIGGGPVTSYDVRYAASDITDDASFSTATPATWSGAIVAPGTQQVFDVTGLVTGTPYYFALKATDAGSQTSGLSNSASATPTF